MVDPRGHRIVQTRGGRADVLAKHLELARRIDLHVDAVAELHLERAATIELAQPDAVVQVDAALAQRRGLVGVRIAPRLALALVAHRVGGKPRGLLGLHRGVLVKHEHHKVFERGEVLGVRGVGGGALVVDVLDKVVLVQVRCKRLGVLRVAVVLCAHQVRLRIVGVDAATQRSLGDAAEQVGGATCWQIGDAHVLAAKRDEVADLGRVAALYVRAEELSALGESDGIEATLQLVDLSELVTRLLDLVVDVAEEALPPVFRVAGGVLRDGMDVEAWEGFL
ncbi:hypothetical protein L1887_62788 [Cichorium endivia]|nr:hypothetical protein L1887_62788 [Cichorium endivia]